MGFGLRAVVLGGHGYYARGGLTLRLSLVNAGGDHDTNPRRPTAGFCGVREMSRRRRNVGINHFVPYLSAPEVTEFREVPGCDSLGDRRCQALGRRRRAIRRCLVTML